MLSLSAHEGAGGSEIVSAAIVCVEGTCGAMIGLVFPTNG